MSNGFNPERSSTFNALERILCSYLIESLNATPINSIIYISRAALMLDEEQIKNNELDRDLIKRIFSISERLSFASYTGLHEIQTRYKLDLSSLDFSSDIDPWSMMKAYDYFLPSNMTNEENAELLDKLDDFEKIIHSAKNLTETGYRHMVSDFLFYALPIVQLWMNKLTRMISPDTYIDMLKVYKGARDD